MINQNAAFDFALLIRARQIIIDYSVAPQITFNHEGPELNVNISDALIRGPAGDLTFQKQAWLCARILMNDALENNQCVQQFFYYKLLSSKTNFICSLLKFNFF